VLILLTCADIKIETAQRSIPIIINEIICNLLNIVAVYLINS